MSSVKTSNKKANGLSKDLQHISDKLHSLHSEPPVSNLVLKEWYQKMHLARILDEKAANYLKQAKGWSYHAPCAGHEGIQLALGYLFRQGVDYLFPYYRDLMTSLAAGITPLEIILNGLSKKDDVAGAGRHMSNHFAKVSINIQNVSSCTGNHALHAVGLAKAIKYYESDAISFYSGGESACAEGYFYEAVNGANTTKLPVIFVVQNNKYGISVPLHEAFANLTVSEQFRGMGNLKIINCDGTDVIDSYKAMQEAIAYIRTGAGPAMVHAQCVRIGSHSNSDKHELYRSPEELAEAKAQDPVLKLRNYLLKNNILSEDEIKDIEAANKKELFAQADIAEAMPDPDGSTYTQFLHPEPYQAHEDRLTTPTEMTLIQALNNTLKEEFRFNPDTFMWGQDVANKEKGGIFNVSKGMQQEFGYARVHNSPIAEDYIVGTANGFSRFNDKIRLAIEGSEFADYFWPAMEQLVEMGHEYWRGCGQFSPNVTVRIASGGFITGGLYHSQTIEAALNSLPGIRIVYPAFADDAAGLLRTCIRSRGANVYLEPKFLYNHPWGKTNVPANFEVPFGVGRTRREGNDVGIICFGNAVHFALQCAEKLASEGISAEVFDLRSIKPIDAEGICNVVKKTNRVIIAHEDHELGGLGGEITAIIMQNCFGYLDAPVLRAASKNTPVGFSHIYEKAILLNADDIYKKAKEVLTF